MSQLDCPQCTNGCPGNDYNGYADPGAFGRCGCPCHRRGVAAGNTAAGITATFIDGSRVTIVARGTDGEGRQQYAYRLIQPGTPRTVAAGDDLRSGVGDAVNCSRALAAWVGFASADAETYAVTMSGDAMQEWAYQHDDELSMLAVELEEQQTQILDPARSPGGGA